MNAIKNWLGLYSKTDKIKEFRQLLLEKSLLLEELDELANSFALNKAQKDDLALIPEQKEKGESCFAEFLKEQVVKISSLNSKQQKIEKSIQSLLKDEEIANILTEIREIDEVRQLCKKGSLDKSVYFDLLKAKQGKVRFADVIVYRGNKILVLQRAGENGSFTDKWCVPGGHVDVGENFKEAAQRELYEETGLDLHESTFTEVGVYSDKNIEIHYFRTYVSTDEPAMIRVDGMEEIGSDWIDPLTEIDKHEFIYDMKDNLKRIVGVQINDCVEPIMKAFVEGFISKSVFENFCEKHKDEIRKSNNKKYFSHSERKDLAKKGEAMPDGKFPIRNSQDLKDAIRLSGSSDSPEYKVRNWIKKRAKELGLEKELPEDWSTSDAREKKKSDSVEKTMDSGDTQILSKESLDDDTKNVTHIQSDNLEKSWRTKKKMTIDYSDDEDNLLKIIEAIKKCGNGGHSFIVVIDPDLSKTDGGNIKIGWDGDGGCNISEIKVEDKKIEKSSTSDISSFGINVEFNDLDQAQLFKSLIGQWKEEGRLDIESVTSTDSISKSIEIEDSEIREECIEFLNWIEGCKTRLKNLHWSEENNAKHIYLDDLNTDLNEFEDKFAEAIQASVGRFEEGEIQGVSVEINDPVEIVTSIFDKVEEMRSLLEEKEDQYHGEISWLDDFAVTLKQDKYRIEMN